MYIKNGEIDIGKIIRHVVIVLVALFLVFGGWILSFAGGFINGANGYDDGFALLLICIGSILSLVFGIWGAVRLYKSND